jgi:hypothetical protein
MIDRGEVALKPHHRLGLQAALHFWGTFEPIERIAGLTLPTARFLVEAGLLDIGTTERGQVGYQINEAGMTALNPPRRADQTQLMPSPR